MKNEDWMQRKCEKCGKPQPKNEKESSKNFDVFDMKAKCECGGKFVTYMYGKKMG